MKYRNHTVFAVALGVVANAPIPALAGISFGSLYPDKMDAFLSGGSERLFFRVHRGFSHWPWTYVVIFMGMLFYPDFMRTLYGQFLMGIAAGSALHVLGDMFTPGGCPIYPWSLRKKFGFGWFKTGTVAEYFFTYSFVLLCGLAVGIQYLFWGIVPDLHIGATIIEAKNVYWELKEVIVRNL
ncbi:metal-dependent hydrolase [Pseudodesulfovibrio pelocollis]|uniref:metal-dependent hydrolase n=1 Tax=Pseudodesulfovibrio pelocollis TaxID=3051432 RepID=UPI00255A96A6|nr:metal-dependent hydrolase [Pseudodesulfovibrio sp. SB368]